MPVSISRGRERPKDTNEFGCAVFSHIPTRRLHGDARAHRLDQRAIRAAALRQEHERSTRTRPTSLVDDLRAAAAIRGALHDARRAATTTAASTRTRTRSRCRTRRAETITVQAPAATSASVGRLTVDLAVPVLPTATPPTRGAAGSTTRRRPTTRRTRTTSRRWAIPGFKNVTPRAGRRSSTSTSRASTCGSSAAAARGHVGRPASSSRRATTGCSPKTRHRTPSCARRTRTDTSRRPRPALRDVHGVRRPRRITSGTGTRRRTGRTSGRSPTPAPGGTAVGTQVSLTTSDTKAVMRRSEPPPPGAGLHAGRAPRRALHRQHRHGRRGRPRAGRACARATA